MYLVTLVHFSILYFSWYFFIFLASYIHYYLSWFFERNCTFSLLHLDTFITLLNAFIHIPSRGRWLAGCVDANTFNEIYTHKLCHNMNYKLIILIKQFASSEHVTSHTHWSSMLERDKKEGTKLCSWKIDQTLLFHVQNENISSHAFAWYNYCLADRCSRAF